MSGRVVIPRTPCRSEGAPRARQAEEQAGGLTPPGHVSGARPVAGRPWRTWSTGRPTRTRGPATRPTGPGSSPRSAATRANSWTTSASSASTPTRSTGSRVSWRAERCRARTRPSRFSPRSRWASCRPPGIEKAWSALRNGERGLRLPPMMDAPRKLVFCLGHLLLAAGVFAVACSSARLYYLDTELPVLEGDRRLVVGPGPWPSVPAVLASMDSVPDDLVLTTLKALMELPGAADSCGADGHPLPHASEYCVGVYRTPEDWRVTWPIRKLEVAHSSCGPPFGGVEDADFGRGLPVFGFAHNHPCGLFASSRDLENFPAGKVPSGAWVYVDYGTTPSGELARDSRGKVMPAGGWLATGNYDAPRFYKWNRAGEVFRWNEDKTQWEFQAVCIPQSSSSIARDLALPPKCSPELIDWY
jgi:hypothetical protein